MPVEDAEMTRSIRRDISRRYVDSTSVDVRVMHGVVYLRGYLENLRGHEEVNLREEADIIIRILRQRPGIRDVVNEMEFGRPGLRNTVKAANKFKR